MASVDRELERSVLDSLVPNLEAEGYRVVIQPPQFMLPPFMEGYRPDAVALKSGANIAIEIISPAREGGDKSRKLSELFSPRSDWRLRVYYAPLGNGDPAIGVARAKDIEDLIAGIPRISETLGPRFALLPAWAALEAAARVLVPDQLARPQPSSRLLELLASEGYVTPEEADALREISHLRNRAAHGDLTVTVSPALIDQLVETIRSLLTMWPNQAPA